MDGQGGQTDVLIFVHGFASGPDCWTTMLNLLRADERITSRYELATWSYSTKVAELDPRKRIARLKELGRSLAGELRLEHYRNRRVTLVGHSLGGLVILSYLAEATRGMGHHLGNIRQVILAATPCRGSTMASWLRWFLSKFIWNPQETALRVLDADVADMIDEVGQRVVNAEANNENEWRVPIHAFIGMQDGIVMEASARGISHSLRFVPGDHSSIIRPTDHADRRYTELAGLLLQPGGHLNSFEVESYDMELRVEPRAHDVVDTPRGRPVPLDNFARMRRTLRFASNNQCTRPFELRYGTEQDDAWVVGRTSHPNEADAREFGHGSTTGRAYPFAFRPRLGETYVFTVDVYNGFPEGARKVHFHFRPDHFFRRMSFTLDLSGYLAAKYTVSVGPKFRLWPKHVDCRELCPVSQSAPPRNPDSHSGDGVYSWVLNDVAEGVVDIEWDVAAPLPLAAASA